MADDAPQAPDTLPPPVSARFTLTLEDRRCSGDPEDDSFATTLSRATVSVSGDELYRLIAGVLLRSDQPYLDRILSQAALEVLEARVSVNEVDGFWPGREEQIDEFYDAARKLAGAWDRYHEKLEAEVRQLADGSGWNTTPGPESHS
jgi:hypothetical protein